MKGDLTTDWADGVYTFRLAMTHILELERKCGNVGIRVIGRRLATDAYSYNDVRETIRLALIGGGLDDRNAEQLVRTYVDERPKGFGVHAAIACAIHVAFLEPFETDPFLNVADKAGTPPIPTAPQTMAAETSPSTPAPSTQQPDELDLLLSNWGEYRLGSSLPS